MNHIELFENYEGEAESKNKKILSNGMKAVKDARVNKVHIWDGGDVITLTYEDVKTIMNLIEKK